MKFHITEGENTTKNSYTPIANNRSVIVFLHGFLGNAHDWDFIVPNFSSKYSCISIDLPGHGDNIFLNDSSYSIENTIDDIYCLLTNLQVQNIILIGYSMGGRVALSFANKYPELISKLILIATTPGLRTPEERTLRITSDKNIIQKLKYSYFNDFLDFWYSQKIFGKQILNDRNMFLRRLQNNKVELIKSLTFAGTGTMSPLWDNLASLQFPTLLLCGELDNKFLQINQEMHSILPNSTLKIISDASHNVLWDNPKDSTNEIINFITS